MTLTMTEWDSVPAGELRLVVTHRGVPTDGALHDGGEANTPCQFVDVRLEGAHE